MRATGARRQPQPRESAARTTRYKDRSRRRAPVGHAAQGHTHALDAMVAQARTAGLRHVSDDTPGLRRKRHGRGFIYVDPEGRQITNPAELQRFAALGIPPAWRDVWISPQPRGHIQATGRDQKGRKQYRYHPLWQCVRDEAKYERMVAFGQALPMIRRHVAAALGEHGLTHEKVLATVVRLLDTTHLRVGNQEYAEENGSYGLTTLRDEHVDVRGNTLRLQFRGKHGKEQSVQVRDSRVARIVRQIEELPGQQLFTYRADDGTARPVESSDVNAYLREITGDDFTAKDFRTWAGTLVAAGALAEGGPAATEAAAKRAISRAIQAAAAHLGNTPAICRKSYVYPAVLDAYRHGMLWPAHTADFPEPADEDAPLTPAPEDGLRPDEHRLLALLQRIAAETTSSAPSARAG